MTHFYEPTFETFVVNGSDIPFTVAGLNNRSCISSLVVIAYPAFVFLVPIVI